MKNLEIYNEDILRDLHLFSISKGEIAGPLTGYPSKDKPWLKYYSEDAIASELVDNMSIYDYMKKNNVSGLNRVAINYYGNLFTYGDVLRKIDEFAIRFEKLGVKKDDIVSICMPSTPETVYSFYALNKLGAVCDMIDPRSNPQQMEYYLNQNKSKLLILCQNYYNVMKKVIDESDLEETILMPITPSAPLGIKLLVDAKTKIDSIGKEVSSNVMEWKQFSKISCDGEVNTQLNSNDLALIIHSSGTTSLPKGIVLTNRNANSIVFQYDLTPLNTSPSTVFLSVIPAFASFGIVASINLPLSLSMEVILMPIVTPKKFVDAVVKYKPNFTLTIPANFINLKNENKIKDLSFLYGPGCGGYSLDSTKEEEINNYLQENKAPNPMLMGWGMSELSSTACLEFPECAHLLSSGVPLVKSTISVFEPKTDKELKYYQEGEICVSSPGVMYGYLNNEEKTNNTILRHSDGKMWLHSNDVGYMDENGRVFPIDRLERMIIKGTDGFKIFPQKIEEVITTIEYVDSCVVVGCNGDLGAYPKAYIVLKKEYVDNSENILGKIKQLCIEKLSIRAVPDEFEFIEELPYTNMGKVDFKKLENINNNIKVRKKVNE